MQFVLLLLFWLLLLPTEWAIAETRHTVNIPAQNAARAFDQLAEQTNSEFIFPYDIAKARNTQTVKGFYTVMEALTIMLQDSGLSCSLSNKGAIRIFLSDGTQDNVEENMSMNNYRKELLASTVAFFVGGGTGVLAQGDDGSQKVTQGNARFALEEIVVTGTKKGRAEDLQVVPIAITAFNTDQIDGMFFEDLGDMGKRIPNVILEPRAVSPGQASFFIRGVGATLATPAADPAVGLVVDGMTIGSSVGVMIDTFDIESIEVLRGPQGALFGRNVTGGVVVVNTKRPTGEFASSIRGTWGSHERKDVAFSIEDSLVDDVLAVRFSAMYKDHEGYFKNDQDPGNKVGDERLSVGRSVIRFTPTEDLVLDLTLEYGKRDIEAPPTRNITNDIGFIPDSDRSVVSMNFTGEGDVSDWKHAVIEANWEVGEGVLTSITAYRDIYTNSSIDLDGAGDFSSFNINGGTSIQVQHFSEELRYAKNFGDSVQLTTGAYYFSQEFHELSQWGGDVNDVGGFFGNGTIDTEVIGLFAQSGINLTEDLIFTVGGRYSQEEKEADIGFIASCDEDFSNCTRFKDDETWSNVSYKLGLQWLLSEDSQVYASLSNGFRSGGYNVEVFSGGTPGPYDEETLDSLELGWKIELLDNRVRLNMAAFVNQYDDFQLQGLFRLPNGELVQKIINAAEVEIIGFETELSVLVTDDLSVVASVGVLDTEIQSILPLDIDFDGDPDAEASKDLELPLVPDLTYNLSVLYDIHVFSGDLITLRANYSYKDEAYGAAAENILITDEIAKLDLSATYRTNDEKLAVSLFGKNVTDELDRDRLTPNNSEAFFNNTFYSAPRTWGVEVQYNF